MKNLKKKLLLLGVLLIVVIFTMVGCGSKDNNINDSNTEENQPAATEEGPEGLPTPELE